MSDLGGPKDGDFVAYLEQMQKESAARLRLPAAPSLPAQGTRFGAPAPNTSSGVERERQIALRRRLRSLSPRARFVIAGMVLGMGTFLSMTGLGFELMVATLFLSGGLLVWAAKGLGEAIDDSPSSPVDHFTKANEDESGDSHTTTR